MAPPTAATGGCLARFGFLVPAGAPLHPVAVVTVQAAPSRFGACRKPGRLVLVAATAATPAPGPGGGDDDNLPSGEDLVVAGKAFLTIEHQANQGYLEAEPLIKGIQGMKLIGSVLLKVKGELVDYKVPVVPSDEVDIVKESFFRELVKLFVMHRSAVYAEATNKYSYGTRSAYDDLLTADKELGVPESRMEETAVAKFCMEMDAFKASHRAATLIVRPYDPDTNTMNSRSYTLKRACGYAEDTFRLLELVLAEDTRIPKELIAAGKALLTVAIQAERQYMEEDALRDGIKALDTIGKMMFDVDLAVRRPLKPPHPVAETSDIFACLFESFNLKTSSLHRLASNKYIWFYPRI